MLNWVVMPGQPESTVAEVFPGVGVVHAAGGVKV